MDALRFVDFLMVAVSALLGWWGKVLWDAVGELRRDMRELESGIPKEYVRKADWDRATDRLISEIRDFRQDLNGQVEKLWTELKVKADKQ